MRISDWSSDVCSSDLLIVVVDVVLHVLVDLVVVEHEQFLERLRIVEQGLEHQRRPPSWQQRRASRRIERIERRPARPRPGTAYAPPVRRRGLGAGRSQAASSEEHTPELQSLMRTSSHVFFMKKKHK